MTPQTDSQECNKTRKEIKFNNQMEIYRKGIVEDLKNGRDISAIICGYGFTFRDQYLKALDWINKNIQKVPMPLENMYLTDIDVIYDDVKRKLCTKCNTLVYFGKTWLGKDYHQCNCFGYRV